MPKEELNLEAINLFDPNNVDHAMALFKDIIRQYKDDINKYKNAENFVTTTPTFEHKQATTAEGSKVTKQKRANGHTGRKFGR